MMAAHAASLDALQARLDKALAEKSTAEMASKGARQQFEQASRAWALKQAELEKLVAASSASSVALNALREEVSTLRAANAKAGGELERANQKLEDASKEWASKEVDLQRLLAEASAASRKSHDAAAARLMSELKSADAENQKLAAQVARLDADLTRITGERDVLQKNAEERSLEAESLRASLRGVNENLARALADEAKAQQQLQGVQQQLDNSTKKWAAKQAELQLELARVSASASAAPEWKAQLEAHEAEARKLRDELESARQAHRGLTDQLSNLNKVTERIRGERNDLQQQFNGLQNKYAGLQVEQMAAVVARRQDKERFEKSRLEFQRVEAELQAALQENELRVAELRAASEKKTRELRESVAKTESLVEQLQDAEAQRTRLEQQLQAAGESRRSEQELDNRKLEESRALAEEAQRQLQELTKQRDALQAQMEESAQRVRELEGQLSGLDSRLTEEQKEKERLQSEWKEQAAMLKEKEAQVARLEEQSATMLKDKAEQATMLKEKEAQVAKLKEQSATMLKDKAEQATMLKEKEAQVAKLKEQAESMLKDKDAHAALSEKATQAKKLFDELLAERRSAVSLADQLQNVRKQLDASQIERAGLRARLEVSAVPALEDKLALTSGLVQQLRAQLAQVGKQYDDCVELRRQSAMRTPDGDPDDGSTGKRNRSGPRRTEDDCDEVRDELARAKKEIERLKNGMPGGPKPFKRAHARRVRVPVRRYLPGVLP
jgi:chromosome segregation ATPase